MTEKSFSLFIPTLESKMSEDYLHMCWLFEFSYIIYIYIKYIYYKCFTALLEPLVMHPRLAASGNGKYYLNILHLGRVYTVDSNNINCHYFLPLTLFQESKWTEKTFFSCERYISCTYIYVESQLAMATLESNSSNYRLRILLKHSIQCRCCVGRTNNVRVRICAHV